MSSENESSQRLMPYIHNPTTNEDPSEAVVATVADATDQSPLELEPLHGTIDPDALDAMVDWADTESAVSVSFEYAGYTVSVSPDGVRLDSTDQPT